MEAPAANFNNNITIEVEITTIHAQNGFWAFLLLYFPHLFGGVRDHLFLGLLQGTVCKAKQTARYIGTAESVDPSFGDVSAALKKEVLIILHGLLVRLPYKMP